MRVLVYGMSGRKLGGIETFLLNMNRWMKADCVFDYAVTDDECIHREKIETRGGRVLMITPVSKNPVRHLLELTRMFRRERKNTRVAYFNLFTTVHMASVLIARLCGYRVILHAHNNGLHTQSKLYVMLHRLGMRVLRGKRYIHWTNSDFSTEFMFGRGVKAEQIYTAIEVDRFRFDMSVRDRVRDAFADNDAFVVGFVGRLTYQKNPVFLLKVFADILRMRDNARLWVIGEGELRDEMEQEIAALGIGESVRWIGRRTDVQELMMGMDLLLQPSRFEGLGIVLVEAQATGLPCVTSAEVVPNETRVTDSIVYVSLAEPQDVWARQAMDLVQSTSGKERLTGFERVAASPFNIATEAVRMEELLRKIDKEGEA